MLVKHRKFEKHLIHCTNKSCDGGYPNALDYLSAVSHSAGNITQQLDIHDGK